MGKGSVKDLISAILLITIYFPLIFVEDIYLIMCLVLTIDYFLTFLPLILRQLLSIHHDIPR